jgi:hypothetical protein
LALIVARDEAVEAVVPNARRRGWIGVARCILKLVRVGKVPRMGLERRARTVWIVNRVLLEMVLLLIDFGRAQIPPWIRDIRHGPMWISEGSLVSAWF